jgi:hypothetical protein
MKQGSGADQVRSRLEGDTTVGLGVVQVVNRGEMAISERRVGHRPEMFSRLELGRVGWQTKQGT